MNSFPAELIYVVAFAAFLLVQYLMKRLGPIEQHRQHGDATDDTPSDLVYEEVKAAATPTPDVTVGYFGRSEASKASVALARPRFAKISLMGTRREVQNAIVIATILGPCRADQPHDVR